MPLYEHKCVACSHIFEQHRRIKDFDKCPDCPKCGRKGCPQVFARTNAGNAHVKVVGVGDETNIIQNEDGTPYRFKTGTEKEQKQELKRELERREEGTPEHLRNRYNIS